MRSPIALLLAFLSLHTPVSAQFVEATGRHLPVAAIDRDRGASESTTADLDGDGDVDVLLGLKYLRNDGHARFEFAGDLSTAWGSSFDSSDIASTPGDFDGDGDTDLIVTVRSWIAGVARGDHLLTNDGTGRFVVSRSMPLLSRLDLHPADGP